MEKSIKTTRQRRSNEKWNYRREGSALDACLHLFFKVNASYPSVFYLKNKQGNTLSHWSNKRKLTAWNGEKSNHWDKLSDSFSGR